MPTYGKSQKLSHHCIPVLLQAEASEENWHIWHHNTPLDQVPRVEVAQSKTEN